MTLITLSTARLTGITACGLFLPLGSLRYALSLPDLSDPSHIAAHIDQGKFVSWAKVADEPDV